MNDLLHAVTFNSHGLVMAVVQEEKTGILLMVAWMNRDTLIETLENRKMVYWSRSRNRRWLKGETSGHFQEVKSVRIDCDGDSLLFTVEQTGAACHENYHSCFFREERNGDWEIIAEKCPT